MPTNDSIDQPPGSSRASLSEANIESNEAVAAFRIQTAERENAEDLDLARLALTHLPSDFRHLTRLRRLRLEHNQLEALPTWISSLSNLEVLTIDNNRFSELPSVIPLLGRLRAVSLNGNSLTTLPPALSGSRRLEQLNCARNAFRELPGAIADLSDTLRSLSFSENSLLDIPQWISRLSKLENFDLGGNKLTSLPDTISELTALKLFNLSENRFSEIPNPLRGLHGLQTLYLHRNQISRIPPWIGELTMLELLALDSNQIESLPAEMAKLPKLRTLDLRDNRLRHVPIEIVAQVPELRIDESLRKRIAQTQPRTAQSDKNAAAQPPLKTLSEPIKLLHLSDFHFREETDVSSRLGALLDSLYTLSNVPSDLDKPSVRELEEVDFLVVSGDFTDRGSKEGFEKAYDFITELKHELKLSDDRCILVPGNHDIVDLEDAFVWRRKKPERGDYNVFVAKTDVDQRIYLVKDPKRYPARLQPFADLIYNKLIPGSKYPPDDIPAQGMCSSFCGFGLQFLCFNSCPSIDEFNRKSSRIDPKAIANASREAERQETEGRKSGHIRPGQSLFRVAVMHHSITGAEGMRNIDFVGRLGQIGVKMVLHGDIHDENRGRDAKERVHIVGSGSFGAKGTDRPESIPCLYNLVELDRSFRSATVRTFQQRTAESKWEPAPLWRDPGTDGHVPHYRIEF